MKHALLVLLSAALWGTSGITAGFLYDSDLSPLAVAFYRLAIASLGLLLGLYFVRKRLRVRLTFKTRLLIGAMGVAQALYQLLYFAAIPYVGVSVATLLALCTAPVVVALISVLLGQEILNVRLIGTLVLAILGTYLLTGGASLAGSAGFVGVLLALGAAVSFAAIVLLGRALSELHPLQPIALSFVLGAAILAPFVASELFVPDPITLRLLLYLGLIPTALSYTLFVWGLRRTKATTASILTLAEPLVATLLAWLLFGERLETLGILGAILLITALLLSTFKYVRKPQF